MFAPYCQQRGIVVVATADRDRTRYFDPTREIGRRMYAVVRRQSQR
jgi:hypothetical protein